MNRNDFYYLYMKVKGYPKQAITNELEIEDSEYDKIERINCENLKNLQDLKREYSDSGNKFFRLSTNMFKGASAQQNGKPAPERIFPTGAIKKIEPSLAKLIKPIFDYNLNFSYGKTYPNYPIFLINNWENMDRGIYSYDGYTSELHLINESEKTRLDLKKAFIHNKIILEADLVIILISQPNLSEHRYQQKGYRFSLLEAGMTLNKIASTANKNYFDSEIIVNYMDELILANLNLDMEKNFIVGSSYIKKM